METPTLVGKYACRLCHHDQFEHDLIVGCPHCRCAATPSEASGRTEEEDRIKILPPGQYFQDWQRPIKTEIDLVPEPTPKEPLTVVPVEDAIKVVLAEWEKFTADSLSLAPGWISAQASGLAEAIGALKTAAWSMATKAKTCRNCQAEIHLASNGQWSDGRRDEYFCPFSIEYKHTPKDDK